MVTWRRKGLRNYTLKTISNRLNNRDFMQFKIAFFFLIFSSIALAQTHTNPGGGVPDDATKDSKECLGQDELATEKEKGFVESFNRKFNSEADFISLLGLIHFDSSLKKLNDSIECTDVNVEVLKSIWNVYKQASTLKPACNTFADRLKHLSTIEKIIETHEKK